MRRWVEAFLIVLAGVMAVAVGTAYVVLGVVAFGGVLIGNNPLTGTEILAARIIVVVVTLLVATVTVHSERGKC